MARTAGIRTSSSSGRRQSNNVMIDPDFLAILACPICDDRPPLHEEGETLVCPKGHRFPVEDGIPHLLPEDELTTKKEGEGALS